MNMDGQIRVKTEARYKELYNNMKNSFAVGDFHELFFVCACIGYHRKKRKAIARGDDRFWSRTITPSEWGCYYAMLLEDNNYDFSMIMDDKKVLSVVEEYANYGMEILIDDFLGSYLLPGSKGKEPQLDPTCSKTLPKDFLHYILEQSEAGSWDN